MGNRHNRAILKILSDSPLNNFISPVAQNGIPYQRSFDRELYTLGIHVYYSTSLLEVDISCCLVQHQDLVLPQQGPGKAHQLPLTNTEVTASLRHLSSKLTLQLLH